MSAWVHTRNHETFPIFSKWGWVRRPAPGAYAWLSDDTKASLISDLRFQSHTLIKVSTPRPPS
jgi:hypothetical protein